MRLRMVKYILFLFILFIFQSACGQETKDWDSKDWETLEKKAVSYFSDPSPKNTSEFLEALPRYKLEKLNVDIYRIIFKEENLNLIERQILENNRKAIDIAYRLFLIADGISAKILEIKLSKLIHTNPSLFLEELKDHQENEYIKRHSLSLLCFTAHLYSEEEALIEINQRIEALERVKDKKLIEIRDRCIEELKDCKNTFENIIKEMKTKK